MKKIFLIISISILINPFNYVFADGHEESGEFDPSWYKKMNWGPYFEYTFQVDGEYSPGDIDTVMNMAYKGLAIRLDKGHGGVSKGNTYVVYDKDLMRLAASWTGEGFVNWRSIAIDDSHGPHLEIVGKTVSLTSEAPGWSQPGTKSFDDKKYRVKGLDNNYYGPLPKSWMSWKGSYVYGDSIVLSYKVGDMDVLEMPSMEQFGKDISIVRNLNISSSENNNILEVAHLKNGSTEIIEFPKFNNSFAILRNPSNDKSVLAVQFISDLDLSWSIENSHLRLNIPASAKSSKVKVLMFDIAEKKLKKLAKNNFSNISPTDLSPFTKGGRQHWNQDVETIVKLSTDDKPVVWDEIIIPNDNPWHSYIRIGGFDFFKDASKAAIATMQGDVWIVNGLGEKIDKLKWQRIASGMYQPLGLKIIDDEVYVLNRDQITILKDFNGDGETDFYHNFNNDHQVSEHYHEFAMDLQEGPDGNLYYMKGARHAKEAVFPHHGTLIKVSKDGSNSEIIAGGFRAPNGLLINKDGSFISSDQEGHWVPKNKINWGEPGDFFGAMGGYHTPFLGKDRSDSEDEMVPPVVWIHNNVDRSPSEQIWLPNEKWGPLDSSLVSISYGYGKLWKVLYETVNGVKQGGIVQIPTNEFATGSHRGRIHPISKELYIGGLFVWSSNKTSPGGFYKVRYTGKTIDIPTKLNVTKTGVLISFSNPIDKESASNPRSYSIEKWNYKRTANYGTSDFRVSDGKKGHDKIYASEVLVSDDAKTVFLKIPNMTVANQMQIKYNFKSENGDWISQLIHHTVHNLGDASSFSNIPGFSIEKLTYFTDDDNENFLNKIKTQDDFTEAGLENGLSMTIMKKSSQEVIDIKKKASLQLLSQ